MRGSIRRALVMAVAYALLSVFAGVAIAEPAPSISPSQLAERRAEKTAPLVVDVRTAEEYALGHVRGAVNIPYDRIAERIADVEAPNGVVLYCMVGPRARKGEAALLEAGYSNVLHLEGGLAAWQSAGYQVEKGN